MRCLILACLMVHCWAVSDDGPFPTPSMRANAWLWAGLYGKGDGTAVVLALTDAAGTRLDIAPGQQPHARPVTITADGRLSDGMQVLDHARRIAQPDLPLIARWVRTTWSDGFDNVSVTVPIPDQRDHPLHAILRDHQATLLRDAQAWMEPTADSGRSGSAGEPLPPFSSRYTDDILTEVTWWSMDLVSTLDWRVYYSGGVHGNTTLAGHCWRRDVAGAWRLITLEDYLGDSASWKPAVQRAIVEDLVRQQAGWYVDADTRMRPGVDTLMRVWSVAGDGLVFSFPPYEVGPYSEGVFQVRIPWRILGRDRP